MRLFISGEVSPGAGQGLRESAVRIMRTVNPSLLDKTYGGGLEVWYFLPIIFDRPLVGFDEVELYNHESKYVEFKKFLDYSVFVSVSGSERLGMIFNGLLESIGIAEDMTIPDFSFVEFRDDLISIGRSQGWV